MNRGLNPKAVAAALLLGCSNADGGRGGDLGAADAADAEVIAVIVTRGGAHSASGDASVDDAGAPGVKDAGGHGDASDWQPTDRDASVQSGGDATVDPVGDASGGSGGSGGSAPSGPLPPIGFHFTDVTQAAGLAVAQWHVPESWAGFPCRNSLLHSGGAAVVDIDDDGWMDLFVTRFEQPNLMYRNKRDGTFEDIAPQAGLDVAAWSNGPAFADIDGDSDLDLFVTSVGPGRSMLFINQGDGTFIEDGAARGVDVGSVDGCSEVTSASFGDYDHDYDMDLYVSHWTRREDINLNSLFMNDGTGHFTDVTQIAGVALTSAFGFSSGFMDADGDGWEELFVASDFGTSRLFRNNQDGTFTDVTTQAGVGIDENGMGSALGDVNGDGHPDWFVTAIYQPGNRLYVNQGDGTFTDLTSAYGVADGGWGWGPVLFDVNNDGKLDAGHVAGFSLYRPPQPLKLWLGGPLPWREVASQAGLADKREGRAILPIDFDKDGDLDTFIVNVADTPALYRNDLELEHHWLVIKATGTTSNAQSIGAHVEVEHPDGTVQHRWITANSTLQGHGPFEAHFGLGQDAGPYQVRVSWPASGNSASAALVTPDQFITLDESCGLDNCQPTSDAGLDAAQ